MHMRLLAAAVASVIIGAAVTAAPGPRSASFPPTFVGGRESPDSDSIAVIRGRYAQIERELARYRRTEHDLVDFSLEGGTLTGFFDGAALRKLDASYYGESFRDEEQYFFWDGQVFFVYRIGLRYEMPRPDSGASVVRRRTEDRFYFSGNRLIRWIDSTGQRRPLSDPAARMEDSTLRALARQLAQCAAAVGPSVACRDTTREE